jgi:hypothetical protein
LNRVRGCDIIRRVRKIDEGSREVLELDLSEANAAYLRQGLEVATRTEFVDLESVHAHARHILESCDGGRLMLERFRRQVERAEDAEREVERLKDVLHTDRSGLAAALEEVWRTAGGYAWAAEGRGPYEYDDEEYRAEIGRMVREICALAQRGLEESGNLAHAECCDRGKR